MKLKNEIERLKRKLVKGILKLTYFISTYEGSDSTHSLDDSNAASDIPPQQTPTDQQQSSQPISQATSSFQSYSDYRQVKQGATQGWYGRVNYWTASEKVLEQELDACVRHGANGYMIELAGWANSTGKMWTDSWLSELEKKYNALLSECRKRKIWLFVSIVNDNIGSKKYGDDGKHTVASEMSYCKKLAEIVRKAGPTGVYVQPVAETQSDGGKKFEQHCISALRGFSLVYNGSGGRPSSAVSGMKHYAVHPSQISASNPSDAFVVSDHGLLIRELNKGGALVAHGDPEKIKTWAKIVKAKGSPVCAYYAFQVQDFDNDAIKALGNTLKSAILDASTQENAQTIVQPVPVDSTHGLDDSSVVSTIAFKSFGSPDCSKAVEDPNTQIKDFRWSRSGMSYKWAKGSLRNWGITNDHDASALAVAGWFDGKEWRFAKFDWISTDRLTRDHKNIEEHYNGFPSEYFSASKHGFFIMSKDGKRRTNVLHQ